MMQINSSQSNYTLILKITSENIKRCKRLKLFGEVTFSIFASHIGNFVHCWRFSRFRLSIHISTNIKLYIKIICGLGLPFILSWSRSKYRYLTNLWSNYYQIWCVCSNMGIWCLANNSAIFVHCEWKFLYRRPVATNILILGMFR